MHSHALKFIPLYICTPYIAVLVAYWPVVHANIHKMLLWLMVLNCTVAKRRIMCNILVWKNFKVHFFVLKDNTHFKRLTASLFFYVFMQFKELGRCGGILHCLIITDILKLSWWQDSIKSWLESHVRWVEYTIVSVGSEPCWYSLWNDAMSESLDMI